jgi:hypothetical protein
VAKEVLAAGTFGQRVAGEPEWRSEAQISEHPEAAFALIDEIAIIAPE